MKDIEEEEEEKDERERRLESCNNTSRGVNERQQHLATNEKKGREG